MNDKQFVWADATIAHAAPFRHSNANPEVEWNPKSFHPKPSNPPKPQRTKPHPKTLDPNTETLNPKTGNPFNP